MYGSIMRAKVKAGKKDEYIRLAKEFVPSAEDYGQGLVSFELAFEDKDPDRAVAIIHFRDRESYMANADRPETDKEWQRQAELLEGDVEWIDINYELFVGKSAGERSGAPV